MGSIRRVALPMSTGVVVALLLGGCVAADTVVDGSTLNPVPTAVPSTAPEEGKDLLAYVVFAGLDADGATVSGSGGVEGVIEPGGQCTFTFSPGSGDDVTVQTEGHPDSTYTSCGVASVAVEKFAAGSWTLVLSYESESGIAESDPFEMEIP